HFFYFFFLLFLPLLISTLFPYTTLFRSYVLKELALLLSHFSGGHCALSSHRLSFSFSVHGFSQESSSFSATQRWDTESSLVPSRSEEHTSELQSRGHLVCRLLLEKKKKN